MIVNMPKLHIPLTKQVAQAKKPVVPKKAPPFKATDDTLPPLLDGDDSDDESDDEDEPPSHPKWQPRSTNSMNPCFFDKSVMGKAWQAQKKQPFVKDNLLQVFMTEPVLFHIILPVLKQGFLMPEDMHSLSCASLPINKLGSEYQRVKDLDWKMLCEPNPHWQTQEQIDDDQVDLWMAMLFHYDMDLAAVQQHIGGNHIGTHQNHIELLA
jgi:hypothetical protein